MSSLRAELDCDGEDTWREAPADCECALEDMMESFDPVDDEFTTWDYDR
jgi:hypothetical protein